MDGSIRVSAKTVDDAITEAMIQLGVTSDRLEYEVIEKGSAGFLGIGMKQAVIEARRKKGAEKENDILEEIKKEVKLEEKKSFKSDFKKEVKKEIKKDTKKSQKELVNEIKDTAVKEESDKDVVTEKTEAGEKKKEKNAATETSAEKENSSSRKSSEVVEVTEETKKAVEKFLSDVFQVMGMEVQIKSEIDKDGVLCIDMSGDNMGIVIGKRGQTLDSLQYLTNLAVNKQSDHYVKVKLDTEDYRKRRKDTLENLARNISYKVKRTKRPVALEPMNPFERRVIHSALQNDRYVSTHSEGEEPYRHVVVTLKRN